MVSLDGTSEEAQRIDGQFSYIGEIVDAIASRFQIGSDMRLTYFDRDFQDYLVLNNLKVNSTQLKLRVRQGGSSPWALSQIQDKDYPWTKQGDIQIEFLLFSFQQKYQNDTF